MDWSLILLRIALIFYSLGFLSSFLPILARLKIGRFTPWLALCGWGAHTAAIVASGIAQSRCPLGTVPEVLSVLAWSAVLVCLLAFWRYRLEVLHVVILPLVLVMLFLSGLLPEEVIPIAPTLKPSLLRLHLTVIIFALAGLSLTFAASVAYLLLDRALKSKRPRHFFHKLPSLEKCDSVGQMALLWAFPLMTLGIVTGALVSASGHRGLFTWEPRETLPVIAWVILGIVVVARLGWGWRGRNAAILTILGFGAALLRMLGIT